MVRSVSCATWLLLQHSTFMRDRLAIRVRVRSERLRGLSVVREAIVWSVRSLRAAGAEVPFGVRLGCLGGLAGRHA